MDDKYSLILENPNTLMCNTNPMQTTVDSRYNSLGPVKLLCHIKMLLYPGYKNNKIQRNFELWDQENYFVISRFCYISVLYNESPLYYMQKIWA